MQAKPRENHRQSHQIVLQRGFTSSHNLYIQLRVRNSLRMAIGRKDFSQLLSQTVHFEAWDYRAGGDNFIVKSTKPYGEANIQTHHCNTLETSLPNFESLQILTNTNPTNMRTLQKQGRKGLCKFSELPKGCN